MMTVKVETQNGIYGYPALNYSYHWISVKKMQEEMKNKVYHHFGPADDIEGDENYLLIHYYDPEAGPKSIYLTKGRLFIINKAGKTVDMMPVRYWN